MRPSRSLLSTALLALLVPAGLVALAPRASAVRVMTYNALNYPGSSGATREPNYRTVIQPIHPDILVMQEMTSLTGVTQFKTNVLDVIFPGEYTLGPFVNGPDTDNIIYYRSSVCTLVSNQQLATALRDISRYQLRMVGYTAPSQDLWIYSAHLKSSTGAANESARLAEATIMRNDGDLRPAGSRIIYAGDFNMQDSTEAAFTYMVGSHADNDGRVHDPINRSGHWTANPAFALVHTQSTMVTGNPYGGATGGVDDRFDFELASTALLSKEGLSYITGTYKAFGNDGLHCCSASIADPPTIPEGAAVANALANTSDHMPVYMDLQLPAHIGVLASLNFGTVIVGASATQSLSIANSAATPADELNYSFSAPAGFTAPVGSFIQNAGFPGTGQNIGMLTATSGNKSGNLSIASDDPDNPTKLVGLSGVVLEHAVPSTLAAGANTLDSLDFGSHDVGGFADLAAGVKNEGYNALQARLDVYGAAITGPDAARFSIVGGFTPALVAGTPAGFNVHFDDTGAAAAGYAATLTFATRDEQALPGASSLASVVYTLKATVTATSAVPIETAPAVTVLLGNYPNPFNPTTTIAFNVAQPVIVRLSIFDVNGRLVRTLVNGDVAPGRYAILWNGRDEHDVAVGSGVYYYRLDTGTMRQVKNMVMTK